MFDVDPYPQIATMREVRPFWEPKWWDLCMAQLMLRDTHWFTVGPHSDMRHLGGVARRWHLSFWLFGIWFGSWIENGLPPCLKLTTAHLKRLAVQFFLQHSLFLGNICSRDFIWKELINLLKSLPRAGTSVTWSGSFLRNGSTLALKITWYLHRWHHDCYTSQRFCRDLWCLEAEKG